VGDRRDGGEQVPVLARRLLDAEPLRRPAISRVIERLGLPAGGRGIDVGCGIGLQAVLVTELVQGARVHGIDLDAVLVAFGASRLGQTGRVTLSCGDALRLPFASGVFDWAWSADFVGYPAGDPEPMLREMLRVTRAGGRVTVLGWTAQQVLAGHRMLAARLDAACSAFAPSLGAWAPAHQFQRALAAFHDAGLADATAFTTVHDVWAPLATGERQALEELVDMLWLEPAGTDGADAWAELQRLRERPGDLFDADGYHAWFAYTVFTGTVASHR
jgi:SAM-dependent methyltransferase